MGVNSLPKTFTRQLRDCDLNPGPSAPESSTLTTSVKILFAIFCTICGLCNSGFKWDKNDNDNNNRGKCMRGLCTRIVGEP